MTTDHYVVVEDAETGRMRIFSPTPVAHHFAKAMRRADGGEDRCPSLLPSILNELGMLRKKAKRAMAASEADALAATKRATAAALHGGEEERAAHAAEATRCTELASLYDKEQVSMKVVMNSVYGFTAADTLRLIALAETITYLGREALSASVDIARRVCGDMGFPESDVVYGDSVTGNTPVLLKYSSSSSVAVVAFARIVESEDAWTPYEHFKPGDTGRRDKQQAKLPAGTLVWACDRWTPVRRVIRHKTRKRIVRVVTPSGMVDCTEDHSLLTSHGTPIKPTECVVGMTKLLHGLPAANVLPQADDVATCNFDDQCCLQKLVLHHITHGRTALFRVPRKGAVSICWKSEDAYHPHTVLAIQFLRDTEDGEFVYDIETTEGCFNAGIGALTVKNTDSIFVHVAGATKEAALDAGSRISSECNAHFERETQSQKLKIEFEALFDATMTRR